MCAPDAELAIGVQLVRPDATACRALLEVERVKRDEIAVYLHPADGTDAYSIHLSRAANSTLAAMLGRVDEREVSHG